MVRGMLTSWAFCRIGCIISCWPAAGWATAGAAA